MNKYMSVDVRREVDGQTDKECTRREMDKGVDAWWENIAGT